MIFGIRFWRIGDGGRKERREGMERCMSIVLSLQK